MLTNGYAYEYTGDRKAWRSSRDDDWDTVILPSSALGKKSMFLGFRVIDGVTMTVWGARKEKRIFAQTMSAARPPKGLTASSSDMLQYSAREYERHRKP